MIARARDALHIFNTHELTCCNFHRSQKRFGGDYGHYRDSRIQDGKTAHGVSGSSQFYFADNQLLAELESTAKQQGLQFIDELIFENGAVYKGKSIISLSSLFLKMLEKHSSHLIHS